MKTIKVPDYLHARLKVQAEEWNVSIWQCIDDLLSDSKGKTELEAVLEQMHMRFDALECSQKSDQFIKAVESEINASQFKQSLMDYDDLSQALYDHISDPSD